MKSCEQHRVLLVVSAPSGAGKTTLCQGLLNEFPSLHYSVSCTTRAPRDGEVDGQSYFFLTDDEFIERKKAGDFIECASVHGHWYGTLRETVEKAFDQNQDVLMDIDVQGARQIRASLTSSEKRLQHAYDDVFIAPPSLDVLQERLQGRGKDSIDVISRRMHKAAEEMQCWQEYRHLILNDDLELAYDALRSLYVTCRHKV